MQYSDFTPAAADTNWGYVTRDTNWGRAAGDTNWGRRVIDIR